MNGCLCVVFGSVKNLRLWQEVSCVAELAAKWKEKMLSRHCQSLQQTAKNQHFSNLFNEKIIYRVCFGNCMARVIHVNRGIV